MAVKWTTVGDQTVETQEAMKRQKAAIAATDLLIRNASFSTFAGEIKEAQDKGRAEEWHDAFARRVVNT